jgi:vanillate O-demethylase ferredoxin subunit
MHLLVRAIRQEAEDILSLELATPGAQPLPAYTPGAHIDLHLAADCTRSYSLVRPYAEGAPYVVAVHKAPTSRGGSRYVHEQLRAGTSMEVGGPRNSFALVEDAPLSVFIAGGIGITPLWCMAQRLQALGRPWQLVYAARSRRKCAYLREIEAVAAAHPGRVRLHIDEEHGAAALDLQAVLAGVPREAHLYCCGPAPMLAAFEQASAGRPPQQVHVEYFSARQAAAAEGGFDVVLARSDRRVRVGAGQTILGALLDAGMNVMHACREGVCGACQTAVLAGVPDHRDAYLSPQERQGGRTMLICCSGSAAGELVLDL